MDIRNRLGSVPARARSAKRDDMASHRARLLKAVREFLALLPAP